MNTLPDDNPRFAAGENLVDAGLLQGIAAMRPGWVVLRDCTLADGDEGTWARVRYVLLHPRIGIALLDVLPGATTLGAPDRLRRLLDAAGFRRAFGEFPPIVYLCIPSRTLPDIGPLLEREFDALPPLATAGEEDWVAAVEPALMAGPSLRLPEKMAVGPQPPPAWMPERGQVEGWLAPPLNPGLRGLAVFWSVVAFTFGSVALVLQYLGPPERHHAAAQAGPNPGEPRPSQAMSETRLAPHNPDKAWRPTPGPVFALWPSEPISTRFDTARAGAPAPEAGDVVGADSSSGEGLSARAAGAAPTKPHRPMVEGGRADAYSTSDGKVPSGPPAIDSAAGAGAAVLDAVTGGGAPPSFGDKSASVTAPRVPSPDLRALLPDASAPTGRVGRLDLALNDAAGEARDEAPPAYVPGAPAAASPNSVAPVPADERGREGASVATPAPSSRESEGTGAFVEREARSDVAPWSAPAPVAPPPAVEPGASETASGPGEGFGMSRGERPGDPAALAGIEASQAASGTAAPSGATPLPSATAVGNAAGPVSEPRVDPAAAAAAHTTGVAAPADAPGAAAAPSTAVEMPVTADSKPLASDAPRSAGVQGEQTDADARPPAPVAAERPPVAGAPAPDAASRGPEASTAQDERPATTPSPAVAEQGTEPSAQPRPATPPVAAAPVNGATPPVAAAEPSNSVRDAPSEAAAPRPPPSLRDAAVQPSASAATGPADAQTPVSPAARVAAPHSPPDEAAQPLGTPTATPRDAAPSVAPPPTRGAEPAQAAATVPVARPATPEPDRRGAPRAEDAERRAPAAFPPSALVDALIARGDAMMARRDISAARLLYERAAVGDARAATALARTYDPLFLAEIGVQGIRGDPALAMTWYRKALALGDSGASARVEALESPQRAGQNRP